MEFMNRSSRPVQPATSAPAAPVASNGRKKLSVPKGLKVASVALLFSGTILVVALIWSVVLGAPTSEGKYVDENRMQAVFLNNGQVYFGRIKDLNKDYVRLSDIFYLRVDQQVQPDQDEQRQAGTPVLVPLGCELHRPQNEMLINRDQVTFWENLKDVADANTVPGAVKKYVAENPNGQQCEQAQSSGSNTAPAASGSSNEGSAEDEDN